MWRVAVVGIVVATTACATTSNGGEALSLLHRAVDAGTVRVLIENLAAEDADTVDVRRVCAESPEAQDMWLDALRLLDMEQALRSYSRCGLGIDVDLIEATKLPLTPARRQRVEQYIEEWKEVPALPDTIFGSTPAVSATSPDYSTIDVLMALRADGAPDALTLCDRLAAKAGDRCRAQPLAGNRVFDTPESATVNDPFLALYKPRLVATSRNRVRRIYLLETLKLPHDDTCRPVAVIKSESGRWSLERVVCETGSGLSKGL